MEHTSLQFLKFMAYKVDFISDKPSHHAAVTCLLAVNIFACNAALDLGLVKSAT